MIDKFRADVEKQHASRELIDATIQKLRQPEKKRCSLVYMIPVAVIAAALILVFIHLGEDKDVFFYNRMDSFVLRDMTVTDEVKVEHVNVGEGTVMIKSAETNVAPESLFEGSKSEIESCDVYLGSDEQETFFAAAFTKDGRNYFFYARGCAKKDFEKYMKEFLE